MARKTIGESPLEAYISSAVIPEVPDVEVQTSVSEKKPSKKPDPTLWKQRLTVQISDVTAERAKNAVYWTRGLTLAQLVEDALEKAVKLLEGESTIYDDSTGQVVKPKGTPFPKRKEDLKAGRPVS